MDFIDNINKANDDFIEKLGGTIDCDACKLMQKFTGKKMCCHANDLYALDKLKREDKNKDNSIGAVTWIIQVVLDKVIDGKELNQPVTFYWTPENITYSFIDLLNDTINSDGDDLKIGVLDERVTDTFGKCNDFRPVLKGLHGDIKYPSSNKNMSEEYKAFRDIVESHQEEFFENAETHEDVLENIGKSNAIDEIRDYFSTLSKEELEGIFSHIIDNGGDSLMRLISDGNIKRFDWRMNRLSTNIQKAMKFHCLGSCSEYAEYYNDLIEKNVHLISDLYFGEDDSEFIDVKMTISQVKCGAKIKDDPFNDMGWDEDFLFDE